MAVDTDTTILAVMLRDVPLATSGPPSLRGSTVQSRGRPFCACVRAHARESHTRTSGMLAQVSHECGGLCALAGSALGDRVGAGCAPAVGEHRLCCSRRTCHAPRRYCCPPTNERPCRHAGRYTRCCVRGQLLAVSNSAPGGLLAVDSSVTSVTTTGVSDALSLQSALIGGCSERLQRM